MQNATDSKYLETVGAVSDVLHEYHRACLEDEMNGLPLTRMRRKREYAQKIIDIVYANYE